jgi:hypothetical protein
MGYDDLSVVDPTAGEATSGKEAAISEVSAAAAAACSCSLSHALGTLPWAMP